MDCYTDLEANGNGQEIRKTAEKKGTKKVKRIE